MPKTPSRRDLTLSLAAAGALPAPVAGQVRPVVTLLGDSIVAGYGLPAPLGLAARLQAALDTLGAPATVRNAGIPGDTSAGGLGRVDTAVRADTAVCVVEFGGNDRGRGLPLTLTRSSLGGIIVKLKARNIEVVLAAMAGRGPASTEFNAVYADLARTHGVTLFPDLMAGVTREAGLMQGDGIHPNPGGVDVIARRLAPVVAEALAARPR